ncbi:hypothetical protein L3V82_13140 [Thiotrichales bacterium 19S3-7]|nr:hypothetical protein [Thiotrichales bacterium 19S3-7]MCF6803114.1 hypothetical protein [Thiotrichales bacterium 19S3-11]
MIIHHKYMHLLSENALLDSDIQLQIEEYTNLLDAFTRNEFLKVDLNYEQMLSSGYRSAINSELAKTFDLIAARVVADILNQETLQGAVNAFTFWTAIAAEARINKKNLQLATAIEAGLTNYYVDRIFSAPLPPPDNVKAKPGYLKLTKKVQNYVDNLKNPKALNSIEDLVYQKEIFPPSSVYSRALTTAKESDKRIKHFKILQSMKHFQNTTPKSSFESVQSELKSLFDINCLGVSIDVPPANDQSDSLFEPAYNKGQKLLADTKAEVINYKLSIAKEKKKEKQAKVEINDTDQSILRNVLHAEALPINRLIDELNKEHRLIPKPLIEHSPKFDSDMMKISQEIDEVVQKLQSALCKFFKTDIFAELIKPENDHLRARFFLGSQLHKIPNLYSKELTAEENASIIARLINSSLEKEAHAPIDYSSFDKWKQFSEGSTSSSSTEKKEEVTASPPSFFKHQKFFKTDSPKKVSSKSSHDEALPLIEAKPSHKRNLNKRRSLMSIPKVKKDNLTCEPTKSSPEITSIPEKSNFSLFKKKSNSSVTTTTNPFYRETHSQTPLASMSEGFTKK